MMKTLYVLKPQNDVGTIFITTSMNKADQVYDNSAEPLATIHMPITNPDTQELVDLYENEWLDLHLDEFKYPISKHGNTYTYENLTCELFLGLLVMYPNILCKMITIEDYKEFPDITTDLKQEVYEFFQAEMQDEGEGFFHA
ncbi:hypothetical protein NB520_03605 [Vibrio antiquarius]|uniref:hypothetical protein n=1 Tax=Vibrio antiquarius (strain Ex25) TaxID=150340 RepID=UPI002659CFCB|nr:hypothetical protein [Vibrio antiquarius]MCR9626928.1 hypothetical protein [Vibrio antiquarius]MCR9630577.1 hypothetical protein [Vibrio antiquarius]